MVKSPFANPKPAPPGRKDAAAREKRLADALRANLRRRKLASTASAAAGRLEKD